MYGPNTYKQVPPKSFWSILLEAYKDPVILLLCAAALVSWLSSGDGRRSCWQLPGCSLHCQQLSCMGTPVHVYCWEVCPVHVG